MDTFVTPEFSSYIQILDCHLRTMWSQFRNRLSLESHSWRKVGGRLIRADSHQSSDSSVEMLDELGSTLASIQEFMAGVSRRLDQIESSHQDPHPVGMVTDEIVPHAFHTTQALPLGTSLVLPPVVPTTDYIRLVEQEARVERLESRMRQIRLQDGGLTWDDKDGTPTASLPAKFHMLDIECYSGIGCPKIHLRLYSTVMRAREIDDAQLVTLFPMSLSGAAQRWFASIEPSRLRTWKDVAHEFLTQFVFSADIDVSRRELEATRPRPDESISFLSIVGGQRWLDLKSLVHAAFNVEEVIVQGLWTDTAHFPDSKGKKPIGSFSRSGEQSKIEESYLESMAKILEAQIHEETKLWSLIVLCLSRSKYARKEHWREENKVKKIEDSSCSLLAHFWSTSRTFLYSVVDSLLKLPDICRKLEAEHLKMKANFTALRE
ncbi:hypothetical protein CK203_111851 [Vitis vinifera]|uniref:Retrotransposon gag domain-containing protein n=1 Tax=Vitis vinifera TaxID=29760 RepID=A0A438CT03_VITVI|nr:hypothetical protein CK203_111851 [Vitis vinifera]